MPGNEPERVVQRRFLKILPCLRNAAFYTLHWVFNVSLLQAYIVSITTKLKGNLAT